jgi:hypothetical protein
VPLEVRLLQATSMARASARADSAAILATPLSRSCPDPGG